MKYPVGILEDIPIKVRNFIFTSRLCNSRNGRGYMDSYHSWETILGHCRVPHRCEDHVEFNLLKIATFPFVSDECNKIDVVDGLT